MDDLVPWLRTCIAEDRRVAGDLPADGVPVHGNRVLAMPAETGVIWPDRWNPVAVLAQCDAHEQILDFCVSDPPCLDGGYVYTDAVLTRLALAYQHRPGYREEWRPDVR